MRPFAFRIHEFKSIEDSGVCILSGDSITVLAGQNEAGKTAVLTALRDFDLEAGAKPTTQDYEPEERADSDTRVSVQFGDWNPSYIASELSKENFTIPRSAAKWLHQNSRLWITRVFKSGQFVLEDSLASEWNDNAEPKAEEAAESEAESSTEQSEVTAPAPKVLQPSEFANWLRDYWPNFVYFDSFQDSLPRQVDFNDVEVSMPAKVAPAKAVKSKVPSSVHDFVVMADLDIERVATLAENDKALGNYLSLRGAAITGDFLTYWKQKVDKEETVDLRVRHLRDAAGTLKLAFYVHDKSDQYPDQRSKGFLWFLSFYLRLAAAHKRYPDRRRILLIDEPGSYLHARAQRDVLHLFEDRITQQDQVLYSTHSPYLIPPERLHRLRIVLKTTAGGTKILDRLTHPDLRGTEFADSLSPVITAIGIDISQSLTFNKERNLFVEGISDHMYLMTWGRLFRPELPERFNVFPGTGATTVPLLGSLFIGWGFKFVVLLDNDDQGQSIQGKLERELTVPRSRIVHPKDAKTIEDLFSVEDFRALLSAMDPSLTLNAGEAPSAAIKRQNIDKVLLARTYSERADKMTLTKKSQESINRLLTELWSAWEQ